MRLIDADKIELDYSGLAHIPSLDFLGTAKYFADQIKSAPSFDAVPVVHGEWITDAGENTLHGVNDKCSICGFRNFSFTFFNYCPNCGAKMDGKRREDNG